jgi:hypothetical protein
MIESDDEKGNEGLTSCVCASNSLLKEKTIFFLRRCNSQQEQTLYEWILATRQKGIAVS